MAGIAEWHGITPTKEMIGKAYAEEIMLMPFVDFWRVFGQHAMTELGMMLSFCAQRAWPVTVKNVPGWNCRTLVQIGESIVTANEVNCPELVFLMVEAIVREKRRLLT